MNVNFIVVILAGGKGMRLWPASRADRPKQFLSFESSGKCLLQITAERLLNLVGGWDRVWVVTISEFAERVKYLLPNLPEGNLLVEPEGHNSAPAMALALIEITNHYEEDVVTGFFPADHWIKNEDAFHRAIQLGSRVAIQQRTMVMLGLPPRLPSSSFGYIEIGELISTHDGISVYHVQGFTEKPDRRMAEKYLESGKFLWNSGIFILQAKYGLEGFRLYAPEILQLLSLKGDDRYAQIPDISFERAVVERVPNASVLSTDFGWNDLGDWNAIEQLLKSRGPDLTSANHLLFDAEGTLIVSTDQEELIMTIGVENIMLVRSGNITVLINRNRISELSDVRERILSQFEDNRFL